MDLKEALMSEGSIDEFEDLYSNFEAPGHTQVDENTVCIKNIGGAAKSEIENFFRPCHPVQSVVLKKTHALVEFKTAKMKSLALKLSGSILKGKKVVVLPKIGDRKQRGPGQRATSRS